MPSITIQGVAVALPNLLRILRVLAPAVFVPKKNLDLLGKGDDITTTNVDWEDPKGSNTPDVRTKTLAPTCSSHQNS